jgi:hypothetical protein
VNGWLRVVLWIRLRPGRAILFALVAWAAAIAALQWWADGPAWVSGTFTSAFASDLAGLPMAVVVLTLVLDRASAEAPLRARHNLAQAVESLVAGLFARGLGDSSAPPATVRRLGLPVGPAAVVGALLEAISAASSRYDGKFPAEDGYGRLLDRPFRNAVLAEALREDGLRPVEGRLADHLSVLREPGGLHVFEARVNRVVAAARSSAVSDHAIRPHVRAMDADRRRRHKTRDRLVMSPILANVARELSGGGRNTDADDWRLLVEYLVHMTDLVYSALLAVHALSDAPAPDAAGRTPDTARRLDRLEAENTRLRSALARSDGEMAPWREAEAWAWI